MAYELVYTSAPQGINRGSSGFCVVACTNGLGPRLIVTLEGLSAYKPLYPHYAPNAWDNPVSFSHYLYNAGGEQQHILSRVCFNGVDYTQRSNKLASHLVLSKQETETAKGGPTSILLHQELFKDASWEIKAETYTAQKKIPATSPRSGVCTAWKTVMGDAGWAGLLAQTFIQTPKRNIYLAYLPEQNKQILQLLHEAACLLPEELRWQLTFSTYFVNLPAGMDCTWRCCPVDSDALRIARRSPGNLIIDISKPQSLNQDSELISAARTGIHKQQPVPTLAKENSSKQKTEGKAPQTISLSEKKAAVLQPPRENTLKPAENSEPVQQESSGIWKVALIASCIVILLIAAAGGGFYFLSLEKGNQLFSEKSTVLAELLERFNYASDEFRDIENTVLKTSEKADEQIRRIQELQKRISNIKEDLSTLEAHQTLFEQHIPDPTLISSFKTPSDLLEDCNNLNQNLKERLKRLKERKAELVKKEENDRKRQKELASEKNPSPAKAQPNKQEEKQQPQNKTKTAAQQTPKNLKPDDPRYVWMKTSEEKTEFEVLVGSTPKEKISVMFYDDDNKSHELPFKGKNHDKIVYTDRRNAKNYCIEVSYDSEKGKLSFSDKPTKEKGILNGRPLILILLNGKEYPLFFCLGISKIKAPEKDKGKIILEEKEVCRVELPESILFPKDYYKRQDDSYKKVDDSKLELRLQNGKEPFGYDKKKGYANIPNKKREEAQKKLNEAEGKKAELVAKKENVRKEWEKQIKHLENLDLIPNNGMIRSFNSRLKELLMTLLGKEALDARIKELPEAQYPSSEEKIFWDCYNEVRGKVKDLQYNIADILKSLTQEQPDGERIIMWIKRTIKEQKMKTIRNSVSMKKDKKNLKLFEDWLEAEEDLQRLHDELIRIASKVKAEEENKISAEIEKQEQVIRGAQENLKKIEKDFEQELKKLKLVLYDKEEKKTYEQQITLEKLIQ